MFKESLPFMFTFFELAFPDSLHLVLFEKGLDKQVKSGWLRVVFTQPFIEKPKHKKITFQSLLEVLFP